MNKNRSDHPLWLFLTILMAFGSIFINALGITDITNKVIAFSLIILMVIIAIRISFEISKEQNHSSNQNIGKITKNLLNLSKIKSYKNIRLVLIILILILVIRILIFFLYSHDPVNKIPVNGSPIVPHATPTKTLTSTPTDPTKLNAPVYIGWIGTDGYLYIAPYNPGTPNQPLVRETQIIQSDSSLSSDTSPAIASLDNELYIVWTGRDQQIYFTIYNNKGQGIVSPLNGLQSNYNPAIAYFKNRLYIVWIGTRDHQLNIAAYTLNQKNIPQMTMQQIPLQQFSYSSPAIAYFKNQLYIAWIGTDDQLNLALYAPHTQMIMQSNLSPAQYALNGTSPALAATSSQLYIAWTGTDNQLNLLPYDPGLTINPTYLAQYTNTNKQSNSTGPALIASKNQLYIAWLYLNHEIEIAPCFTNQALTGITVLQLKSKTSPALAALF